MDDSEVETTGVDPICYQLDITSATGGQQGSPERRTFRASEKQQDLAAWDCHA